MGSLNIRKSSGEPELLAQSAMPQGKPECLIALLSELNQKLNPEAPPLNLSLEDYPYDDIKRLITDLEQNLETRAQDPAIAKKLIEEFRQAAGLLLILRRVEIGKPYTEDGGSVGLGKHAIDGCLTRLAGQIGKIEVRPYLSSRDIIDSLDSTSGATAPADLIDSHLEEDEPSIVKHEDRTGINPGSSDIETTPNWQRFFGGLVLSIEPRILSGDKLYDPHQLYEKRGKACWAELKLSPVTKHYVFEHTQGGLKLPTFEFKFADLLRGIPFPPGLIPFHATRNDESISLNIERSIFGFFRLVNTHLCTPSDTLRISYVPYAHDAKDEIQKERNAAYSFLESLPQVNPKTIMSLPAAVRDEIMCPGDHTTWAEQLRQMIIAYDFVGLDKQDVSRLKNHPDYLPLS